MSELVYLGHASFLIKGKEYQIVIDPYENGSVPNLKFPKVEPVDAVIASHSHADHSAYHLVPIKDNPNRVSAKMLRVPHDHENGAKRGMNLIHIFDVDGNKYQLEIDLSDKHDVGETAAFKPTEKGVLLMRWIRRANENDTLIKIK